MINVNHSLSQTIIVIHLACVVVILVNRSVVDLFLLFLIHLHFSLIASEHLREDSLEREMG